MSIVKAFFPESHRHKAIDRMKAQFPQIIDKNNDFGFDYSMFETKWYETQPYVLILNCIENGRLIRKEWYEYDKSSWDYVGYLARERCIEIYRWQAWKKNIKDFPKYDDYATYMISRSRWSDEETEEQARRFPEVYFEQYRSLNLKK